MYGNVNLPVKKIPTTSHRKNSQGNFTPDALETVRVELAELRQAVTLMLDDKTAREEERRQLQEEVRRLEDELQRGKNRGIWSRLFPGSIKK